MIIINNKTLVSYKSRTSKDGVFFKSIVTRRLGNTETLVSMEKHPTRSKAYKYANTMVKSLAANHAYIN